MLNPFPQLLVFGFFGPMLLRLAAAGVFFYLAYFYVVHRDEIGHAPLPLIGAVGPGIAWFIATATGLIGAGFLFGYYTQIIAILGMLGMVKYVVYRRFFPHLVALLFPLSTGTMLLFFIICLSLLVSGAGALAFDLPL